MTIFLWLLTPSISGRPRAAKPRRGVPSVYVCMSSHLCNTFITIRTPMLCVAHLVMWYL